MVNTIQAEWLQTSWQTTTATKAPPICQNHTYIESEKQSGKNKNPEPCMTAPFTSAELNSATHKLKAKKALEKDGITNEMIKNPGP